MGLGEILSLASAMVWALAVILFKRSGESLSPLSLNLFKTAVAVALLVITIPLVHGLSWPQFSTTHWLIMIASGGLGIAIADGMYFAALNAMGASRTGLASSLYSPFVVSLSFLFLGERFNTVQGMGFMLVLISVVLLSLKSDRREVSTEQLRRGVPLAIGGVFLMAAGVVMMKPVLDHGEFLWIVQIRLLAALVLMILWGLARHRLATVIAEYRAERHWRQASIASFLGGYLAMALWLAGYKYAPASVASVLNETAAIFILLLAWLMLGEALSARKILCVGLSFGGVLLLTLGG